MRISKHRSNSTVDLRQFRMNHKVATGYTYIQQQNNYKFVNSNVLVNRIIFSKQTTYD